MEHTAGPTTMMTSDAGVADVGQRRFRQRGGAGKKKQRDKARRKASAFSSAQQEQCANEHASKLPRPPHADCGQTYVPDHTVATYPQPPTSQLTPELSQYLHQVRDDLASVDSFGSSNPPLEEGDESPRLLLSRNALTSITAHIHEVSADLMGSRVLETLVQVAVEHDDPCIASVLNALLSLGARRVIALATHRCGSHVLQALFAGVLRGESGAAAAFDDEALLHMLSTDWTTTDLVDTMSSPCGSHVFRALIAGLAGVPVAEPREHRLDDTSGAKRPLPHCLSHAVWVPDRWLRAVAAAAQRIAAVDAGALVWCAPACAALQTLLCAAARADRGTGQRLAEAALAGGSLEELCADGCAGRFVERVVACLGTAQVLPGVRGRFAVMAADGRANFVLQRVLLGLRGRGAVMAAWDELEPVLGTVVGCGSGRDGVALALLRASEVEGDEHVRRRAARAVSRCVGAVGAKGKRLCGVLAMGTMGKWEKWCAGVKEWEAAGMMVPVVKDTVAQTDVVLNTGFLVSRCSLLGVLMARCMLRLPGGPGQMARDSMANLTPGEVVAMCVDPSGSRLIEQWIETDGTEGTGKVASNVVRVVMDAREKDGLLGPACRSPYAAQVLIRALGRTQGPIRKRTMDALAARSAHLREDTHGRQVLKKYRVFEYMRRKDEWSAEETAREARTRMFADILNEPQGDAFLRNDREDGGGSLERLSKDKGEKKEKRKRDKREDRKEMKDTCSSEVAERRKTCMNESKKVKKEKKDSKKRKRARRETGGDFEAHLPDNVVDKRVGKRCSEGGTTDGGGNGLESVLSAIEKAAVVPGNRTGTRKKRRTG